VIRDVVLVEGTDARDYLQGQLSQDVVALEVGDSAFALLLQPQGKVAAWLRVTRIGGEVYALDVEPGWGEKVEARLRRFLLRTKATLRLEQWPVAVHPAPGPEVPEGAWAVVSELDGTIALLGATGGLDDEELEERRIAGGVPRLGRELDESTIPAAAGIVDRSVSFTKGCYTGQELVARIDSRGDRVPSKLRRISGGRVRVGDTIVVDGREVGTVTSAAGQFALGYVRREVELPTDADVGAERVRIEA
jgi:folate-binding protein YgfZ